MEKGYKQMGFNPTNPAEKKDKAIETEIKKSFFESIKSAMRTILWASLIVCGESILITFLWNFCYGDLYHVTVAKGILTVVMIRLLFRTTNLEAKSKNN